MSAPNEPLKLDQADLFSPRVEAFLEERAALKRAMPEIEPRSLLSRVVYSSYFYLAMAGALGALVAWMAIEPFFDDNEVREEGIEVVALLLFPTVAGFVGMFVGAAEGIMCRNYQRAAISAAVGLGVGFGGGFVALIPTGIVFVIMSNVSASFQKNRQQGGMPTGFALILFMMGRSAAWALASIPAGLGQGIAVRERKVLLNGLVGAVMGGMIGGLLFDPISLIFTTDAGEANLSRAVGFVTIGVMVGIFIGLVEQWTKTAWLLMRAGPLAGKQFVLYKNPTVLGSSPKADVYLFKDDAIEPRHALVHNRGGRFEIEDCNTPDGTYVNGIPIKSQLLRAGDQIVLGKTVLEFSLKDTK